MTRAESLEEVRDFTGKGEDLIGVPAHVKYSSLAFSLDFPS